MRIILSPSKRQEFAEEWKGKETTPTFEKEAITLGKSVAKLKPVELKTKLGLSDKLADEAKELWTNWLMGELGSPAIATFQGDVYDGLDFKSLSDGEQNACAERSIVMSALYGVLRGTDLIRPYRLDLKDKIQANGKGLGAYWKPKTQSWFEEDEYVDLTSTEYTVLLPSKLPGKSVRVDFKEQKDGKLKSVSFFGKKARGVFARWMVQTQPKSFEELKRFDLEGYRWNAEASSESVYIFSR